MVTIMDNIQKNTLKIMEKYNSVISALTKAAAVVSKKEGRRELTMKLQDLYQFKMKSINNSKGKHCALNYVFD